MIKLGLIGKNIQQSKSKSIYEELLLREIDYQLFDIPDTNEVDNLEKYFSKVEGLSITSPYKKIFSSKVNIISDVSDLGVINCIRKNESRFEATNTDYLAVLDFITANTQKNYHWVLLGDGSMAEITIFALEKLGVEYSQYSRKLTPDFQKLDLDLLKNKFNKEVFVVNSCSKNYTYNGPVGSGIVFWDYNYNHLEHFKRINKSEAVYIDGLNLLKEQAKYALKFWGLN